MFSERGENARSDGEPDFKAIQESPAAVADGAIIHREWIFLQTTRAVQIAGGAAQNGVAIVQQREQEQSGVRERDWFVHAQCARHIINRPTRRTDGGTV